MGERKKTCPETFRGPHHGPEAATTAERFANIKAVHVTWADVDEGWCTNIWIQNILSGFLNKMLELTSIEISNLTWAKKAIGHRHLDLHHDLRWVWCHQGPVRLSLTMALILAGVLARGWCSCREAESFLLKLNIIQCYWNFMDKIVKRKQTVTVLILVPMQLKVEWTILTFQTFHSVF